MKKEKDQNREHNSPKWWLFGGTSSAAVFGSLAALLHLKKKEDKKEMNKKVKKLISAKKTFIVLLCILICCVILTACLLASRLERYFYSRSSDMEIDLLGTEPGYAMDDGSGKEVFSAESDLTLFHVSYANDKGELTAFSSAGDRIVAPGTDGQYTIRLKNTGDVQLYFTLTLDGFFSTNKEHRIPICVRLKGIDGDYLIGSETEWTPIDKLRNISDTGSLDPKATHLYTLEWKWPYESGMDDLDTMLGSGVILDNPTADVNFTMAARTTAMAPANTRPVFTIISEYVFPVLLVILMVLLIWAIVMLIRYRTNEKKRAKKQIRESKPESPLDIDINTDNLV